MRRRRRGAVALISVLAAAAAVPAGIRILSPESWGCVLGAVSFTSVDVPPDDATPEDVVRTYLQALDARDAGTAAELYPPPNGQGSWACNVRTIDDVGITADGSGDAAQAGNGMVRLTAAFTVHRFDESAAGEDNGPVWRSYELRRQGEGGPWRIVTAGQG